MSGFQRFNGLAAPVPHSMKKFLQKFTAEKVFNPRISFGVNWILSLVFICGVSGIFFSQNVQAQEAEESVDSNSFEAFQLLLQRNIFDANRRRPIPPTERRPEPPPPPRQETFSLVGVFMNGDEKVAFFEGSDGDYSGSRKVGETIADFIIREVEFSHAKLERETKDSDEPEETQESEAPSAEGSLENLENPEDPSPEVTDFPSEPNLALIELPVGQGMSRRGEDPWELTESPSFSRNSFGSGRSGFGRGSSRNESERESSREESDESEAATDSGEDSGGMSDILKQMMERRKQEMNK